MENPRIQSIQTKGTADENEEGFGMVLNQRRRTPSVDERGQTDQQRDASFGNALPWHQLLFGNGIPRSPAKLCATCAQKNVPRSQVGLGGKYSARGRSAGYQVPSLKRIRMAGQCSLATQVRQVAGRRKEVETRKPNKTALVTGVRVLFCSNYFLNFSKNSFRYASNLPSIIDCRIFLTRFTKKCTL